MDLKDRVCIVTGAGSGIGEATARLFAKEGAIVIIADRNEAAAQNVANDIERNAHPYVVDVSQQDSVRTMVQWVKSRFERIDVLVNNAGFGFTGSVVETSEEDWNRLMGVNVNGVFFGCKHTIPVMRDQGGGVIVNVASVVASVGIRDRAAYCASKGAVAALTRAMALDHVKENIRINSVAPGTIESPYHREMLASADAPKQHLDDLKARQAMGRLGKPEEVAQAILFLASDRASFATGSMLVIDGGWTAQ